MYKLFVNKTFTLCIPQLGTVHRLLYKLKNKIGALDCVCNVVVGSILVSIKQTMWNINRTRIRTGTLGILSQPGVTRGLKGCGPPEYTRWDSCFFPHEDYYNLDLSCIIITYRTVHISVMEYQTVLIEYFTDNYIVYQYLGLSKYFEIKVE